MKRNYFIYLVALPLLFLTCGKTAAMDADSTFVSAPGGYAFKDSVVYVPVPAMDTLLAGKNIFSLLPSKVKGNLADVFVHQSASIRGVMDAHFVSNSARPISGYRVRIFFDNRQSARADSQKVMDEFSEKYHGIPVYRSYVNPYFKVTAGDFRSKSEAMQLLQKIRQEFPSAFIVKEKSINYPALDKSNAVVADTIRVLYRIPEKITL